MNLSFGHGWFLVVCWLVLSPAGSVSLADDVRTIRPFLERYCIDCHGGDEVHANIDFTSIQSSEDVINAFEIWKKTVQQLKVGSMPPDGVDQPSPDETQQVVDWYQHLLETVEAAPAIFQPRRLSVMEYRNTLASVLGFHLEVAFIEAEQTVAERSLVVKLLPTDPPGASGFTNDTHSNPFTPLIWDQYSYLVDAAVTELFSEAQRQQLTTLIGSEEEPLSDARKISPLQAQQLLLTIAERAQRRPLSSEKRSRLIASLNGKSSVDLLEAVQFEIKATLMSPQFIYRGLLFEGEAGHRQPVDDYELAERLSYFLWGDMPDQRLRQLASTGRLSDDEVVQRQIVRMLASPKSRYLSDVFATEWLTLNEIEKTSNDVPRQVALKSQPLDFMQDLFVSDRPLLELIDSRTAFVNPFTAKMYGSDAKQLKKYVRRKGIEREIVANQKIQLSSTTERGGMLTMPGILAMNRGPILRGTWILERILGEQLPEPPANVGQVPASPPGQNLTFRQRFAMHRSDSTCAVCHDRIDPLGFALQGYGDDGRFLKTGDAQLVDTSGQLPSGEVFGNFAELKKILSTTQKETVIRNIVERTFSFALCRRLTLQDHPEIQRVTRLMMTSKGTWQQLFLEVANSIPFRETVLPPSGSPATGQD